MRVVCPACAAVYEVPAPVVEARRTLRCATCGSQFPAAEASRSGSATGTTARTAPDRSLTPNAGDPAVPEGAALRVSEAARLPMSGEIASPAPRRRFSAPVLAGWVFSLMLLGAGAGAAVAWRQPIMRAWPPAARAYAALGYGY